MSKGSTAIIALLLIVIALLAWLLIVKSAEAPTVPVDTNIPATSGATGTPGDVSSAPKPLHERVVVTYPTKGENVAKKFTVTGKAPGNWFFEASAPVMVITPEGEKIHQGIAQTIDDWMTTELVEFKAEVSTNPAYSGPATLVLLKDNPSGLPEHEDSLEIPITIE